MPALLLGEALVDLVCEHPVEDLAQADAFVPHPGGAIANVAVTAARMGASVALAGGAGADPWGAWLRDHLRDEGVDLRWFALLEGVRTPIAFVTVDAAGQPSFLVHGDDIASTVVALADRLGEAIGACDALVLASNTLVGEEEREVTMTAREQALGLGLPVIFDPNLRLHRWPSAARAAAAARQCLDGAFLVKCNRAEAEVLSGEADPEAAAGGLLAGGAQHVVVTLGAGGAILRGGGLRLDVPGRAAAVVDATGAGDVLVGALLAHLMASRFYPPTLAAALPDAVERATRATERFGAT